MTSRATRRARKRNRITLPGGDVIDSALTGRAASGRTPQEAPEDAQAVALAARQRITGQEGPDALQPILCTDLGRCIVALTEGQERRELAEAWAAMSAAHRNYRLLYIGQTGDPQGAAIGMVPDRLETDQSLRVDLRSHDERVQAAKTAWAAWDAKIKALPWPQMAWALRGALDGFMGEAALWRDRAPTAQGRIGVDALRAITTTA